MLINKEKLRFAANDSADECLRISARFSTGLNMRMSAPDSARGYGSWQTIQNGNRLVTHRKSALACGISNLCRPIVGPSFVDYPTMKRSLVAMLLLCSVAAIAQDSRRGPTKESLVLITADASVRSLDVYSTHWMLKNGDHEILLPGLIAEHSAAMATYSAGVVICDWRLMRRLEYKHPKLAHTLMMIEIGQDGYFALNNLLLRKGTMRR
jgi:hypothetical protein